ncbi:DUF1877 family protein [Streptomyces sp. B21-083]|uniref:DUF1877 family protein n=1 Tax=Streptomyces sp. B21-083 TaxID=3039410 RepID=UPI002FF22534
MNISLVPISVTDAVGGFQQIVSRFRADSESSVDSCGLGEEGDVIQNLLSHVYSGEIAEAVVFGKTLLGDDGVGTVCALLSVGEVQEVAEALGSVSVQEVMSYAPRYLSGVIRGEIPNGYLEYLEQTVIEVCEIYRFASREGMCMAQIYEG